MFVEGFPKENQCETYHTHVNTTSHLISVSHVTKLAHALSVECRNILIKKECVDKEKSFLVNLNY